jgi:hypothetical protein
MVHWHGLAKLRMHSDLTLDIMDQVTTTLGYQFHTFNTQVCSVYDTRELCQEVDACKQRCAKQAVKYLAILKGKQTVHTASHGVNSHRTKLFNFQTYKFHALGDYVLTI